MESGKLIRKRNKDKRIMSMLLRALKIRFVNLLSPKQLGHFLHIIIHAIDYSEL